MARNGLSNTLVGENLDGYADFYSNPIPLWNVEMYSIICDFDDLLDTVAGTLTLEFSNSADDIIRLRPSRAVWVTLPDSSLTVAGDDQYYWNNHWVAYRWVRVKFVRSAGGASVDIYFNFKGA